MQHFVKTFLLCCPGLEALVIIVVSLTCTTYHCGSLVVLCVSARHCFSYGLTCGAGRMHSSG